MVGSPPRTTGARRFRAADALAAPSRDYGRIILPPSTYAQEKEKIEKRFPAALRFVAEQRAERLHSTGEADDIGIVLQGGLYNSMLRALELLGCADTFGTTQDSALLPQCHLSAGAGRVGEVLRRQAGGAGRGGGAAGVHRAGGERRFCASTMCSARLVGKDVLPHARRVHRRCAAEGAGRVHREVGAAAVARHARARPLPAERPPLRSRGSAAGAGRGASRRWFRRGRRVCAPAVRSVRSSPP